MTKEQEIMDYLHKHIFDPVLNSAEASNELKHYTYEREKCSEHVKNTMASGLRNREVNKVRKLLRMKAL